MVYRTAIAITATGALTLLLRARLISALKRLRENAAFDSTYWQEHTAARDANGFFGIGIVTGKTQANLGTLWRSAYQFGASFTFTVGARHAKLKADTASCWQHLPAHQYSDFEALAASAPFGTQLVAIEMGGGGAGSNKR